MEARHRVTGQYQTGWFCVCGAELHVRDISPYTKQNKKKERDWLARHALKPIIAHGITFHALAYCNFETRISDDVYLKVYYYHLNPEKLRYKYRLGTCCYSYEMKFPDTVTTLQAGCEYAVAWLKAKLEEMRRCLETSAGENK